MRRAARAWAAGGDCSQCPLAPVYPSKCVAEDPEEMWRDDVEGDGGAECPVFLGREFENYFVAFSFFEKGILPEAGGWAQQSHHWIQALKVIDPIVTYAQHERLEQFRKAEH